MPEISTMYGRDAELEKLQQTLKRTVRLCKTIWYERDTIEEIKKAIEDDLPYASGLWNDLDYKTQSLLITAPKFGGAFTTKEREIVRGLWNLTVADIEGTK